MNEFERVFGTGLRRTTDGMIEKIQVYIDALYEILRVDPAEYSFGDGDPLGTIEHCDKCIEMQAIARKVLNLPEPR